MAHSLKLQFLLVDDHALVREGLRMALELSDEIQCIEAGSAEESLKILDKGVPVDLVLLDICLPGMSGLEALEIIHERFPQIPVLMHSMYPEEQYAACAERLGAVGFLSKSTPVAKIMDTVRSAARGEYCFSKNADSHSSRIDS